jgi:hypothetical protein
MSFCVELFFLFSWQEGHLVIGEVTPSQLSHHNHHDGGSTEFLRKLGHGKGRVQMEYPNPEGM